MKKRKTSVTKKNPSGQTPAPMGMAKEKRRRSIVKTFNQRGGLARNY